MYAVLQDIYRRYIPSPEKIVCILFATYLTLLFFSRFSLNFDQDEIEAVHTSWKMWRGGEPFKDFFQHHHLLLHYLLTPLFYIFGESFALVQAARAIIFCNFLGICAVTYALGTRIFGSWSALSGTILYATMWLVFKSLEIRPDNPQVLFGLIALFFMYQHEESKKLSKLVLSALAWSVSFMFLQKAIFLGVFMGFSLLSQVYRRKMSVMHLLLFAVVAVAPFAVYCLYLYSVDALEVYITLNWLLNILHSGKFSSRYALSMIGMHERLLCVFYVLGLCYGLTTPQQKSLGLASLWLLFVASFLVKFAYFQYYIPAFPLMGLIAGHAVYSLFKEKPSMLMLFLTVVMIGPLVGATVNIAKLFVQNNDQHEKMKYVLRMTQPDEYVYDGKSFFNLFRSDIDYFWFEARTDHTKSDLIPVLQDLTGRTYDCYAALKKYRPRVISSYYIHMNHPFIYNNYIPSPLYDDVYLYKGDTRDE